MGQFRALRLHPCEGGHYDPHRQGQFRHRADLSATNCIAHGCSDALVSRSSTSSMPLAIETQGDPLKHRITMLAIAALAVTIIASGCGDDGETGATTTTGGATGTTAAVKNTASDTGVTETTIKVAIHSSDLAGLVKAGAIKGVPEDAGPSNAKRISYYLDKWNAEGGINGRKFEYTLIQWDPADPKSYQTSCQKVIDAKVFMVIASGGGYPPDSTPCIAVDGKTQYMGLDAVSAKQFKEMNGNFINLSPPGAASAQAEYGSAREERNGVAEDGESRRAAQRLRLRDRAHTPRSTRSSSARTTTSSTAKR